MLDFHAGIPMYAQSHQESFKVHNWFMVNLHIHGDRSHRKSHSKAQIVKQA